MIATGVYLDDIEEAIAHLRQDTRQRYQTEVYRLFIFTAVFLVLTCLLAWYFHKNITATFQRYSRDISEKEQQLRQTNRALEEKVKQRTREVRKSERNFRSMIEKSPLPILVIDHTGKILLINEKFSQVFGYTREDLVTESDWWEALFPDPTYCQEIQATWYQNMRQSPEESGPESSTHTWNVVTKHQAGKTCEFHLVPMKDFSLVVMNDITAKLEAEQERQRLEKQLLQAQKMEAIGTLAGGIAHDFNNLLASIIGFTELVLEDLTEDNLTRDNLREVLKAGNRAKELVLQILTFARQTDDQVSQVELGPIIKETMKFLQATTPKTIEFSQAIDSTSCVTGNPGQLHQVIMNLATNAIHALEDSGGIIRVALHDSWNASPLFSSNSVASHGKYLELVVEDNGPGISPEILDKIFDPYFTTKEIGRGTGMGLAMVKGIVESYGGKIMVSSKPGMGTRFTVAFPVSEPPPADIPKTQVYQEAGAGHILLIDDEVSVRKVASRLLESLGYCVTSCADSTEALKTFRKNRDAFGLVITDMTMPGMTGDSLARAIKEIRPNIPIILSSGYSSKIDPESMGLAGIDYYLQKPYVKAELSQALGRLLDRHTP